jgi:hypothetical protein
MRGSPRRRWARWGWIAALPFVGCGPSASELADVAAQPPPSVEALRARASAGSYAVRGVTVQARTGSQREIAGDLALRIDGDRYEVDFELSTTAPDLEGNVPVVIRGTGRGFLVGGLFTGTTEEWMHLQTDATTLAEVDLGATLPARAGIKIVSSSQGRVSPEGVLQIVLQNEPAPGGARYVPSVTTLEGRRLPED